MKLDQRPVWKQAMRTAAAPDRVVHRLQELSSGEAAVRLADADEEQARVLSALFSGSQALSDQLIASPEWLSLLTPQNLRYARRIEGMRREIGAWLEPALTAEEYGAAWQNLRRFNQRELCRIAARDLARLAGCVEITRELSDLAEATLSAALRLCWEPLRRRFGEPYHQDAQGAWHRTEFSVLGLGKLGGRELNYSSDVDLMFVYTEEGTVWKQPPRRGAKPGAGLISHQFFKRLAESLVTEVTRATGEGALYRVDLRLRPEGDAGPLVRSLASCENYYAQWGQTWERMMLIKARCVAGDGGLAEEFMETIQTFRYPRHLNERVLREMAAMKRRIETEVVKAGEMDRNVKLGRGGIREIEFIVQTSQMLHGGHSPFLQGPQTLPALEKMVQYHLLAEKDAEGLSRAYCFLRDVEHRLQMEGNLQTHVIPVAPAARERLGRLMGFASFDEFENRRREHAELVRRLYEQQVQMDNGETATLYPRDLRQETDRWEQILKQHGFRDPAHSLRLLTAFVLGPGYMHVSPRTTELAWELVPKLLALCPPPDQSEAAERFDPARKLLSDPDRVLARLDSFISRYGARSMLFETWTHNPAYFELLLLLFDRSEFLAETALRTPDLVDDLVLSGRLNRGKTTAETLADLRYGLQDPDQHLWIRRYHQAELMRIGLRDILGLADFEQNLTELSNLADACLQYALEVALRKRRRKKAPFVILGLGKLGGRELNFGSDLDIMFVAPARSSNLPDLQRLAKEVMDLLSARTEQGLAFETDARLRPDGDKGLLVNTVDAVEDYYRHRAQLWEIQALSRIRPIAGDLPLGERFRSIVGGLANFSPANVAQGFRIPSPRRAGSHQSRAATLAAYAPDWKQQIAAMRQRIEKERTPVGQEALAIKTGAGGLMDVEFIAQTMCLEQGWLEPNTQQVLETICERQTLPARDAQSLLDHYRHLRRIEGILRRWSLEGETELPVDPAPYRRVSIRCGFSTPDAFREAVAQWRHEIRRVYQLVFSA